MDRGIDNWQPLNQPLNPFKARKIDIYAEQLGVDEVNVLGNTHAAHYYNAVQTVSSWAKIMFSSVRFDESNALRDGEYTCPVDGLYDIDTLITWKGIGGGDGTMLIALAVNDNVVERGGRVYASAYTTTSMGLKLQLRRGDRISVYATAGASRELENPYAYLSVVCLRDDSVRDALKKELARLRSLVRRLAEKTNTDEASIENI